MQWLPDHLIRKMWDGKIVCSLLFVVYSYGEKVIMIYSIFDNKKYELSTCELQTTNYKPLDKAGLKLI